MKLLVCLFTCISGLLFSNSYLDLQVAVDPKDLRGQTHFNFAAPHVFFHKGGSFVLTPEARVYTNSNIELGCSLAKKFEIGANVAGLHLFYDRSQIEGNSFHQTGIGAVYSTDMFDITSNYYLPFKAKKVKDRWNAVTTSGWVDSEILFKTPYFKVGTGPTYNVDYNAFALHSRIIIPTPTCCLSLGGLVGDGGFNQAYLSLSFNLMKNGEITSLSTPISRTQKCCVSFYTEDLKKAKKLQEYVEQVERDMTMPKKVNARNSSIKPIGEDLPQEDQAPQSE